MINVKNNLDYYTSSQTNRLKKQNVKSKQELPLAEARKEASKIQCGTL